MKEYLEGKKLYGDDFSIEEIMRWYNDEKEAYAELGAADLNSYKYAYHALNEELGFNYLDKNKKFDNVLSFGGAWGFELLPIIDRIKNITIIDSSEKFGNNQILKKNIKYFNPSITGKITFDNECFDLITCFGTLHHIPNVSYVLSEIIRVLRPSGYLLIREPIISMGDWTKERSKGVTKRERGIPLNIFKDLITIDKIFIVSQKLCVFAPLAKLGRKFKIEIYNNKYFVKIDKILSNLFSFNYSYHPKSNFQKIRPTSIFYVLQKSI